MTFTPKFIVHCGGKGVVVAILNPSSVMLGNVVQMSE